MVDCTLHLSEVKGRCPWCDEPLSHGQIIWDYKKQPYHEGCLIIFLAERVARLESGFNPYGS